MITRVYIVRIVPALREEFEPLFKTVARASVAGCAGCSHVTVGFPSSNAPDDYAMITVWESEDSLCNFAGSDWTVPHIPPGMEKFVDTCWLHHFHHD
ncbi:antibiotic biosynthesis monooxygenase family protein [Jannaschia seohaensis]|uniref:Antibiotic biosynthesis monooxygenase n=1 Tax=Jannaschia seohaensis TaxID=475081 RepID=A0A2Y9B4E4_9RHOB|nr:antibiotic biosynthesis monooxygenase [Jannaschia seohaensis]PWJ13845.1 antibiotic biosynthesis monooxygenase [Jannaschia seohaensis]SSA50358.1 Antibiotic biosynthesis monooxygenase [Jannaschia seohaensis]